MADDWRSTPKAYRWLQPNDYDDVQVGDVVTLQSKDGPENFMGKVVFMDGWQLQLNNREEYFSLPDWFVKVLLRDS